MYINKKRVSLPDTAGTYLSYALVDLMEKKPLEEISITELTKKSRCFPYELLPQF